jgi:hypothetical protein
LSWRLKSNPCMQTISLQAEIGNLPQCLSGTNLLHHSSVCRMPSSKENRGAWRKSRAAAVVSRCELRTSQVAMVKILECAEGPRFFMRGIEDKRNRMGAALGLRYRIGKSGTPAAGLSVAGITDHPGVSWMSQVACNATLEEWGYRDI